jgi:hypothetical protein
MPVLAAFPEPVVQYCGLDKLHVMIALQAAHQTALNRCQTSGLAAHCAESWGVEGLQPDTLSNLGSTGIPAGLHGTVLQLVLGLLTLCATFKGHEELRVLTTGLKMLQLVQLFDAAQQHHIQGNFADVISANAARAGGSGSTAAAAASPSVEELASAVIGPLVTVLGQFCAKGQADHPFAQQLFPPMGWDQLFAAEEGGELLPLCGGLLRDALLVMSPAGTLLQSLW